MRGNFHVRFGKGVILIHPISLFYSFFFFFSLVFVPLSILKLVISISIRCYFSTVKTNRTSLNLNDDRVIYLQSNTGFVLPILLLFSSYTVALVFTGVEEPLRLGVTYLNENFYTSRFLYCPPTDITRLPHYITNMTDYLSSVANISPTLTIIPNPSVSSAFPYPQSSLTFYNPINTMVSAVPTNLIYTIPTVYVNIITHTQVDMPIITTVTTIVTETLTTGVTSTVTETICAGGEAYGDALDRQLYGYIAGGLFAVGTIASGIAYFVTSTSQYIGILNLFLGLIGILTYGLGTNFLYDLVTDIIK